MKPNTSVPEQENKTLKFEYEPARDVNPLELVGNASLALHHHMAPADGAFDLDADEKPAS